MTKRERILSGMGVSGGTKAPGSRRAQIAKALSSSGGVPPMRFPQASPQRRPAPTRGAPIKGPGSPSVSQGYQPKLGQQLSNRVQSGVISGAQAQKTAGQRDLLRKAFGSDWRSQVFGKGGARGVQGSFSKADILAKRSQAISRAKRKLY